MFHEPIAQAHKQNCFSGSLYNDAASVAIAPVAIAAAIAIVAFIAVVAIITTAVAIASATSAGG
jgi:hypothetical protein